MKKFINHQKNKWQAFAKMLTVSALMSIGFTAGAQCTANFTYVVNPADNGEVTFTNTSSGTGLYYQWNFGDGAYDYSTSPTHVYNATGTYNVALYMHDTLSALCNDTITYAVNVINNTPVCHAYFTTVDSLGGDTYFINYSTGTALTYFWNFGDGDTLTTFGGAMHHYAHGMHSPCLTVTNADATCSDTYCDTVVTSSCHVSFTFTPDASGFGGTFTAVSTGSPDTFDWNFGDGSTAIGASAYHVYAAAGNYLVQVNGSSTTDPACGDIHYDYVNVANSCNANFTLVQDSMDLYHYYIFTNVTSSSILYSWDFGDGYTTSSAAPTHSYAGTGPYYLCLTVFTADSTCMNTHCDSIYAGRADETLSVTVVNPMATGISETTALSTSLTNYPNPFNGSTTINYSISQDAAVELYVLDLLGNKVASLENNRMQAGNYSEVWNVGAGLAQGMYLLQLRVNNRVITKKMVINN